jgi:glycosyltransferase involved in cell wall biosynthesis
MKVVHLVTSLDFGGLERRMEILSLYPSIKSELIFCALGKGGATYEKILSHRSQVHLLECDPKIFNLKTFMKLREFFKKIRPDVLHTHGAEANFYGHLAAVALGIKVRVAEEIGIPNLSPLARISFSNVFRLPQAVIAMSPVVKEFLAENNIVRNEKIHLVYNPVLLSDKKKNADNNIKTRFIFIGRLEEVKNPLGLLRSFHKLLSERQDIELVYVGDGSQRKEIEAYIENEDIGEHISCVGFSSDPLSIALSCDVVVQPSHSEGFSLALVEAMSCGLPAVVTPVGSAYVLIENDVNGWVVGSSEDKDIFNGLKKAVNQRSHLFDMGINAANKVSTRHDPKLYAEKLEDFYVSLGAQS